MHGQFIFRKRTFLTPVSAGISSRSRWNLVEAVLAKIKRRLRSQAFEVSQISRSDRALRELFGVAYFPATVVEGEPVIADRQPFVSSVFGDVFDVLTESDGSVDFTQPEDLVGNGWPSNNTRNGSPKALRVLNSMAGEDDVV